MLCGSRSVVGWDTWANAYFCYLNGALSRLQLSVTFPGSRSPGQPPPSHSPLSPVVQQMATPATASTVTICSSGVKGDMQEVRRSMNGAETSAQDELNGTPRRDEEAPTTRSKHHDEKFVADVKTEESEPAGWRDEEITFPDGGWRAWMVVAGAMCCTFST